MQFIFMMFSARSLSVIFNRFLSIVVLAMVVSTSSADESDFPVPPSILPAINFWVKVYTEADTQSGFLHDSHNLNIVYEKLSRDRKLIEEHRNQIVADLKVLSTGKRTGLSPSQQRLLMQWGRDASSERLLEASRNVRWQLGQADRYREGLIRSGAYRAHIESVVKQKGLPVELAALPHVESSFHPGAYSSAAASGMWQFVRETAQRFMRVDLIVDERLDPYIASNAAMELLKYNYDALGSWPLALTAYNHGTNGMARAVRDTGTRDIGKIISDYKGPRFGFASRNFYPQFLAALKVEQNAEQFYGHVVKDTQPEFASISMNGFVDAAVVAKALGISVDTLRKSNPALLPGIWSGNKRIPKGYKLKINRDVFNGNIESSIASITAANFYTAQIPDVSYKIRKGDSLSVIADRFDTSVAELVAINQLRDRNTIRIGQTLVLPQKNGVIPTLLVSDTGSQVIPDNGKYEVKRGDTISIIAQRHRLGADALLAMNNLDSSSVIYPGQELVLRAQTPVAPASTPALALEANAQESQEDGVIELETVDASAEAAVTTQVASAVAIEESGEEPEIVLATDPSDFMVAQNGSIQILAEETLGHYADWLKINTSQLRKLNNLGYNAPVKVGDRLQLNFSKVGIADFEQKRKVFHSQLQQSYFAAWRIMDTERYSIKRRDMLMTLAQQRSIPMWLFLQYNPSVDAAVLQIGQVIVFPVVEKITN